jgi:hypothetical protein
MDEESFETFAARQVKQYWGTPPFPVHEMQSRKIIFEFCDQVFRDTGWGILCVTPVPGSDFVTITIACNKEMALGESLGIVYKIPAAWFDKIMKHDDREGDYMICIS